MAKLEAPGPYAEFGAWLRDKRVAARFVSQPQAEIRARARGLKLINQGKLSHIETGKNGDPDPIFLQQLSELYGLNYDDVVIRWMQVKYSVVSDDSSVLSLPGSTRQRIPHPKGESDVPASDRRIAELERRLSEYEALVGEVQNVASLLTKRLAGVGKQGATPARAQRSRSRRDRKTG